MKRISMNPRFPTLLARDRGFSSDAPPIFVPRPERPANSSLARPRIVVESCGSFHPRDNLVEPAPLTFLPDTLADVAAGRPRAMNRCIASHGAVVWGIVKRYVPDTSEAEDLVQEIFTEIWKKAASFDPAIAGECTFVGMIARRRAIDFLRRRGRQPGFETLDALDALGHDPWEEVPVNWDADAVRSSVANLPAETRELFHLFFEKGYTHPEIADKTGLPLGTIKTRLRRGLITLREQMQRTGNPNPSMSS